MVRLKHLMITLSFFLLACLTVQGQTRQERFEAIENQKTAYITNQLKLTPKEAQQFFPLYNQYRKEIRGVKEKRSKDVRSPRTQRSFRPGNDVIAYDSQTVDIKKKYREKFAEAIGQSRASQFFAVEQEFIELLYKELNSRKKR